MRKQTIYFLTVAVLFCGMNFLAAQIASQTNPFTMGQILRAIASINDASGNQKKVLSDKVLNDVRRRTVDFPLTKENEKLLRDEGASDDLIETIRQNSLPLPTPTPTPKPSPTPFVTPTPYNSSTSSESYLKQARQYRADNRLSEANAAFTKAIEADPYNDEAYAERADINDDDFSDKDRMNKAIADYTQAIRLKPDNFWYWFFRALLYQYYSHEYEKAIADYNEVININKGNFVFYRERGKCHEALANYQSAIDDYRKSLELSPGNVDAKEGLDRVLKKKP